MAEDFVVENLNQIVAKMTVVGDFVVEKLDMMYEVAAVVFDSLLMTMMMEGFDERNFVRNLVKIEQHFVKVVT
jgi:hypothetical protein